MKRRTKKNKFKEKGTNKVQKIEENGLNGECKIKEIPKVLIRYLSSFLDLKSLFRFSSTNKEYRNLFYDLRKGFIYLKEVGFDSDFKMKDKKKSKKEFLKEVLLKKEISLLVNKIYKSTPLQCACKDIDISFEMIKNFVDNKSDLNSMNNSFQIPLHYACRNEKVSLEIVQYLVENKSNLNSEKYYNGNPLHHAIQNNTISVDIIKYLVESKSDLNSQNCSKETCLQLVTKNENFVKKIKEQFGEESNIQQILKDFQK